MAAVPFMTFDDRLPILLLQEDEWCVC